MIPARLNINLMKSERFTPWKRFQLWAGQRVPARPSTIFKMLAARLLIASLGPVGWGATSLVALSLITTGLVLGGEYTKHCGYVALGVVFGGLF